MGASVGVVVTGASVVVTGASVGVAVTGASEVVGEAVVGANVVVVTPPSPQISSDKHMPVACVNAQHCELLEYDDLPNGGMSLFVQIPPSL